MTIRITQPNNGNASTAVRVELDGIYIGTLGPGDSISGQSAAAENEPWHLVATCGMFRAEAYGLHDAVFHIAWTIPDKMELRHAKQ